MSDIDVKKARDSVGEFLANIGIDSMPLKPGEYIGLGAGEPPLAFQVGGNHYSKLAIQPAEYTTRNGLGHMAGDAIAYITRYKDKGGKQDLEKAIHSIQLLIEFEYPDHE
jgi:hypothetical protein